jgi:serpin B
MDKVLRVAGWDRLGAGLSSLNQLLASRDAVWKPYEDAEEQHQLALRIANMAFGQRDYAIERAYLDRIGKTFASGLGLVDYIKDPAGAREAINGWVSRQTMGRIPSLLAPENVTDTSRLILVNAIYLKAEWALPFDVDQTQSRTFTTLAGTRVKVPTMYQAGGQDAPLATGKGWRATELRYAGPDGSTPLAMTLILPDDMKAFERLLSPALLGQVQQRLSAERKRLSKLQYTAADWADMRCGNYAYSLDLYLPKFGIDTRADLIPSLRALGMKVPFDDAADFTGITATDPLHIGMVIHQANIDVDEQGTEAAAATAVGMDTTGGCGEPSPRTTKTLRLKKPFLFLLRDVQTGAILFMGRVMDPTVRS